jgi:hypothetical protein
LHATLRCTKHFLRSGLKIALSLFFVKAWSGITRLGVVHWARNPYTQGTPAWILSREQRGLETRCWEYYILKLLHKSMFWNEGQQLNLCHLQTLDWEIFCHN